MTSGQSSEQATLPTHDLASYSYTALRLEHASPEHIHLTTRRCFIGPIPEGWLKSHRKSWYKRYLSLSDYSSRTATFSAKPGISHHRQITGLDGPSATATFARSFPQPADIDEGSDDTGNAGTSTDSGHDSDGGNSEEAINRLEALSTAVETVDDNHARPEAEEEPSHRKVERRSTFRDRMLPKKDGLPRSASSFVTAPEKPLKPFKSRLATISSGESPAGSSYVTAKDNLISRVTAGESTEAGSSKPDNSLEPPQQSTNISPTSTTRLMETRSSAGDLMAGGNKNNSTASLLPHGVNDGDDNPSKSQGHPSRMTDYPNGEEPLQTAHGMVRFNVADTIDRSGTRTTVKAKQVGVRRSWARTRRGQSHPGEIVKMEKMLVHVDSTMQELPSDYNENDSLKFEFRTVEKWREFVVVCRESTTEGSEFSLQMYKTRVIPSLETTHVKKRSTHEIPLSRKTTRVNLYSSLDKTLVIWVPWNKGTMAYILRTRSAASAVEWYTFIRHSLGWQRSAGLQVSVPDLSLILELENPFRELEASMSAAQAIKADEAAIGKTMEAERAVAGIVIRRSIDMLLQNPEWSDVLEHWLAKEKIGLAWKRYDRLEWVHGANEQRMYGTLAMQQTHELELRPKHHYPTKVKSSTESFDEPAPVEGFLIRLTSQKGRVRRLGKMYFKRLYFTTHNQFLCYCRPAKALPPPSPKLSLSGNAKVPSPSEIADQTPLIYAVNPYPHEDGQIEWLHQGNAVSKVRHDEDAYKEAERKVNSMLQAEGYINLSHVVRVQNAQRGNYPADSNVDQGPDVDFHEEVDDTPRDDGKTDQFDDKRTFELVMKNRLVIRLQAYNEVTKKEWMSRLRKLVDYWKLRLAGDMDLFKSIRNQNLKRLEIDEHTESFIGQFGSKWEVTRSVASPQLFNMCGISCCRAITMSGTLYRKPKRHSLFQRCGVILCHGQLLIFHGTLRETSGKEVAHIQHQRQAAVDLKNCYIYSGLVTEGDLLYQNRTFDSNNPGHHALPRIYPEDGWTSTDEDVMTCFVIWQPKNKSLFKSNEEQESGKTRQRLRYVSQLGVPGRSIVFKTRSRAERDHWVMSISMEIDRLQVGEDVRVVDKKN